jgi:hypothetical protein
LSRPRSSSVPSSVRHVFSQELDPRHNGR